MSHSLLLFLGFTIFLGFSVTSFAVSSEGCYANGWSKEELFVLKENNFETTQDKIVKLTQQLPVCLGSTDPEVRDGIAYEALFTWIRAKSIPKEQLLILFSQMTVALTKREADEYGVYLPFIALVYSEVVRSDRVNSYLTDQQRQSAVEAVTGYLSGITDYRGFDKDIGWRHGVAHGSDVVLQLALNKEINAVQLQQLGGALASQINADGEHFYTFGEPERLARAFAYLTLRDEVAMAHWEAWLKEVSSPTPFDAWGDVFMSEAGLAKRNNVRQFLVNLYAMIAASKNERLVKLTSIVAERIAGTN